MNAIPRALVEFRLELVDLRLLVQDLVHVGVRHDGLGLARKPVAKINLFFVVVEKNRNILRMIFLLSFAFHVFISTHTFDKYVPIFLL